MDILRIGTRKSLLALKQAQEVRENLLREFPATAVDIIPMETTGDIRTESPLADIGGKGLFTKELEEALLSGRIDIAVHSLKDMETRIKDEFILAAMLPRADARDALIMQQQGTLATLRQGARIGTSSLRRAALLRMMRPDIEVIPFRGNVNTRLDKLSRGEADATLLAVAGLERLGLQHVITQRLDVAEFTPAVGQGIITIECRTKDEKIRGMLTRLNHETSWIAAAAERSLLARLDGSCRTPIAAHAVVEGGDIHLTALIAKPDGTRHVKAARRGTKTDAIRIGKDLAEELLAKGGAQCLA